MAVGVEVGMGALILWWIWSWPWSGWGADCTIRLLGAGAVVEGSVSVWMVLVEHLLVGRCRLRVVGVENFETWSESGRRSAPMSC